MSTNLTQVRRDLVKLVESTIPMQKESDVEAVTKRAYTLINKLVKHSKEKEMLRRFYDDHLNSINNKLPYIRMARA